MIALAAPACRERKPKVYVERYEIDADGFERGGGALKAEEARSIFEAELKAANGFVVMEPDTQVPEGHPQVRLRAEVFLDGQPDVAERRLAGVLSVQWRKSDGPERFELETGVDCPEGSDAAVTRKALTQLARELLRSGGLRVEAERKVDVALVKDLHSSDFAVREAAAQVLVQRRRPEVIPELERLLQSQEPSRVRRAMGGLVELKAKSAVPTLIDLARGKDLGFLREVIFALGSIGGEEAEAYLFTVSQGHDQPLIRDAADEALAELRTAQSAAKTMRPEGKR
jgi:hypothetical protein